MCLPSSTIHLLLVCGLWLGVSLSSLLFIIVVEGFHAIIGKSSQVTFLFRVLSLISFIFTNNALLFLDYTTSFATSLNHMFIFSTIFGHKINFAKGIIICVKLDPSMTFYPMASSAIQQALCLFNISIYPLGSTSTPFLMGSPSLTNFFHASVLRRSIFSLQDGSYQISSPSHVGVSYVTPCSSLHYLCFYSFSYVSLRPQLISFVSQNSVASLVICQRPRDS